MWFFVTVALALPPLLPCADIERAVALGTVRLDDESLYARGAANGCLAAVAALGTVGTPSARDRLAQLSPEHRSYGLAHDPSDAGIDALLGVWVRSDGDLVPRVLSDEHPMAAAVGVPPRDTCVGDGLAWDPWAPEGALEGLVMSPPGGRPVFVGGSTGGKVLASHDGGAFLDRGEARIALEAQFQPWSDEFLVGSARLDPGLPHSGDASVDGRWAVVMFNDGRFALYDVSHAHPGQTVPIAWSGDVDADLATGTVVTPVPHRRAQRIDLGSKPGGLRPIGALAFSPDGRALVTVGVRPHLGDIVQIWDAATGERWQQVAFTAPTALEGFDGGGRLLLKAGMWRHYRLRLSPAGNGSPELVSDSAPVEECIAVEVVTGGKRELRRFSPEGLPCDEP